MRLLEIGIGRYGCLEELVLEDLGAGVPLVVLGDNEAGKSTLREALLDLLGGFRASRLERHPYRPRDGGRPRLRARFADDGEAVEFERRLDDAARAIERRGGRERDRDDLPFPSVGLDRERLAAVFLPTAEDLAAAARALTGGLEPRWRGGADLLDAATAVEALRREAATLWRVDRRGQPRARELERAIRAARERRVQAAEEEAALRRLRERESALRRELGELAAALAEAREELDVARRRRRDLERRDRDASRALEARISEGRRAERLLRREEPLRAALAVLAAEAEEELAPSPGWRAVQERLGEGAAAALPELLALDVDRAEARLALRRDRRAFQRGLLVLAAFFGAALLAFEVLPREIGLALAAAPLLPWWFLRRQEGARLRRDLVDVGRERLAALDEGRGLEAALDVWRRGREAAVDETERTRRRQRRTDRRARAERALGIFARRLGVDLRPDDVGAWRDLLREARRARELGRAAEQRRRELADEGRLDATEVDGIARVRARLSELDGARTEGFERLGALREEAGRRAAARTTAELDGEIAWLEDRREALLRRRDRLAIAAALIERAERASRDALEPRLFAGAGRRLAALTGGRYEAISAREDGALSVRAAEGHWHEVTETFSRGTREQIGLALRLALADLLDPERVLPLVLDEAFAHWDAGRRAGAWTLLARLAGERPVILATCHPALAREGRARAAARIVTLPGAERDAGISRTLAAD
ncbi:MAG: AAA family ATPase [Planctomycetota bacterium]